MNAAQAEEFSEGSMQLTVAEPDPEKEGEAVLQREPDLGSHDRPGFGAWLPRNA